MSKHQNLKPKRQVKHFSRFEDWSRRFANLTGPGANLPVAMALAALGGAYKHRGKGGKHPPKRAIKPGNMPGGRIYPFSSARQDARNARTQVMRNGLMQTLPANQRQPV